MTLPIVVTTCAPDRQDVLTFFKAVADETRLAILRLLALTDLRSGEIVERLRRPSNAVAHHLKALRALGLVRSRRSSADARDVYYSLDLDRLAALFLAAGAALHPVLGETAVTAALRAHAEGDAETVRPGLDTRPRPRVLFLCTANSARSQMAEGLLRHLGRGWVAAYSAGSQPTQVHPLAVRVLREVGVDIADQQAKGLEAFAGERFDYVITLCDRMREVCPAFPGDPARIHWSFPAPAAVEGTEAARYRAFQQTAHELTTRLRNLMAMIEREKGGRT